MKNNQEVSLLWDSFVDALQSNVENKSGFWTDGERILCKSKEQIDTVAKFFEGLGLSNIYTGYYDPEEDEIDGLVDKYTGHYYVIVE